MPNYEELYYIARNKYYQSIEERNYIRRRTSDLQGQKSSLLRSVETRRAELAQIRNKKSLLQAALDKCQKILNEEFPAMKKDLNRASEEYIKIITSDKGVANIAEVYGADILNTQKNLDTVIDRYTKMIRNVEAQETEKQGEINQANDELSSINMQLRNVGSESAAQTKINNYYAEMKVYERKWQEGE